MTAKEHRVKCGKPKPRASHWHDKATTFAREHGLEVKLVEAEHDHRSDLLEWDGAPRAEAEWRAWNEVVELMTPRRAA